MHSAGNTRVRELDPAEWRTWRDLRLRALTDSPDSFGQTLEHGEAIPEAEWLEMAAVVPGNYPLLVLADEKPVGMAFVKVAAPLADLYAMWVDPAARGAGAGEALVRHAIALAQRDGVHEFSLRVSESNTAAERLYEKCGFQYTGDREPLRQGSHILTRHMVLPLSSQ